MPLRRLIVSYAGASPTHETHSFCDPRHLIVSINAEALIDNQCQIRKTIFTMTKSRTEQVCLRSLAQMARRRWLDNPRMKHTVDVDITAKAMVEPDGIEPTT